MRLIDGKPSAGYISFPLATRGEAVMLSLGCCGRERGESERDGRGGEREGERKGRVELEGGRRREGEKGEIEMEREGEEGRGRKKKGETERGRGRERGGEEERVEE